MKLPSAFRAIAFLAGMLLPVLGQNSEWGSANAAVFSSRAAFEAATSSLTTIDFNGTAGPGGVTNRGSSYLLNGVTFNANVIFSLGPGSGFAADSIYGSDYLEWQGDGPNLLTASFPSPITAVGFDFAELRGLVDTFTIEIEAEAFIRNTAPNAASFFGFTSTTPFTLLSITDLNSLTDIISPTLIFPTIDNLSFGAAATSSVPEPGSFALLAIALAAFGIARRKT